MLAQALMRLFRVLPLGEGLMWIKTHSIRLRIDDQHEKTKSIMPNNQEHSMGTTTPQWLNERFWVTPQSQTEGRESTWPQSPPSREEEQPRALLVRLPPSCFWLPQVRYGAHEGLHTLHLHLVPLRHVRQHGQGLHPRRRRSGWSVEGLLSRHWVNNPRTKLILALSSSSPGHHADGGLAAGHAVELHVQPRPASSSPATHPAAQHVKMREVPPLVVMATVLPHLCTS